MRQWARAAAIMVALLAWVMTGACDSVGSGASPRADEPEPQQSTESPEARPDLPAVRFERAAGGTVTLYVEVADTSELMTCGLMHRLSMPENQAMLFVFAADSISPFWNRNTFIPLTLAWITADGVIASLADMDPVSPEDNPQSNTFTFSNTVYRYVIEANRGWFERNNLAVGDRADLSEAIAHGSQGAIPICRQKGL